ncbi:AFR022Cp [Eremothecium gossypii ATCC 10895]|uniref:Phosphatidylserine decarboxylase proenzyme 1, mitochondrial n=1 Tax=Eremothecium gossypii (strain ATCC 10895 / CBS 109.51 / FGSC 9923 / NRRL Y-1056) TaxID=284811 RepID=Q754Q0_EREGS|nr:AFR022Cp [Eremothecium gossypii ATCC 10895]AAS53393.1 AFR022Cp [Eremothecium gossypii ATCC 10895]AEY97704.1 FAFR022Cp [Eremothecium gossypii FDAG1]
MLGFGGNKLVHRSRGMRLNMNITSNSLLVARRGLDAGLRLKRKTNEFIWNSKSYYSTAKEHSKQHRAGAMRFAAASGGRNFMKTKWVVMTGVTLVLGSLILSQKRHSERDEDKQADAKQKPKIRIFNNNWFFFCYSTLPLNAMSRMWGQVNSVALPVWLRPWGYKLYSVIFGVKLDEMDDPDLTHYQNLSQFFYRMIKPECRPIDERENVVVCPSDGTVLQLGIIDSESGDIEQIKGLTYSVKEFLGTHSHPMITRSSSSDSLCQNEHDDTKHREFARINNIPYSLQDIIGDTPGTQGEDAHIQLIQYESEGDKVLNNSNIPPSKVVKLLSELSTHYVGKLAANDPSHTQLYFAVIYLSPGDYHHYHSPVNWVCKLRRHFPGELFSVAPYFQRNFPNLFILNERVALLGHWKHGFFSMTPVGATNVGSIKLNFDKELVTNSRSNRHLKPHTCYEATYETASKILGGVPLVKGEEMGGFMLGSTVVLCFEAPSNFKFDIHVGDAVKMGQSLGQIN